MKYFKLLLFFRIFLSLLKTIFCGREWNPWFCLLPCLPTSDFNYSSSSPRIFFFFALLDVVKTVHKLWLWFSEGNLLFRLCIQQWWIKFNSFSTPHENKFSRYKSLRWILSKTNSFTSCTTFNFFLCYIYSFLCTCSYSSSLVSPGAML